MTTSKIIWTKVDEAPALATYALLPVVRAFTRGTGIDVETRDISLAGRIIANFPDKLTEEQRIPDDLTALGEICQTPEANIIKLPNISATIPQLQAALKELREKGYDIPEYPEEPKTEAEKALRARFSTVLGSAVNPVLREGNSDRRPAASVKRFAPEEPPQDDEAVAQIRLQGPGGPHDRKGLLRERAIGHAGETHRGADRVLSPEGKVSVLKKEALAAGRRGHRRRGDERRRPAAVLRRADRGGPKDGVLLSLHLKATMMKVSDPIMFGHCVSVYYPRRARQARRGARGRSAPTSTTAWPTSSRSSTGCPPTRRPRSRPTSTRSTRRGRPWPWSTRARASPTCTCPTTSSSTPRCPTSSATAARCGTRRTSCRTASP